MPAWVEPVTLQTTIVSKKTPSSRLLLLHLVGPVGEAEPAERVVGGAGRDRVGRAAGPLDVVERPLPAVLELDAEPGRVEPDVGAHDPGQQDVADLVVDRIGPVDPALLHQHGLQAELGRDGGDLPGVVGLHAADRHQGVGALGERVRERGTRACGSCCRRRRGRSCTSSRLAQIAAPPRCCGQPVQRVDRAGPEGQRVAGKILDGHEQTYSRQIRRARGITPPPSGASGRWRPQATVRRARCPCGTARWHRR